jgi:branched-subunit amino acid transport protein
VNTWVAILTVGAGSFAFRLVPLLLLEHRHLGERADRVIRHGGLAAITALIAVSAVHSSDGGNAVPTLGAVALALALAGRGRSMLRIMVCAGAMYAALEVLRHLVTG